MPDGRLIQQNEPVITRRLVLVRHAKAALSSGADFDRPLTARGERDASALGRWLADDGLVPHRIVVSPARRATRTWQLAAAQLPAKTASFPDARLYGNTLADLLAVVRATPADIDTLVLVGHNPSVATLALTLDDGAGDASARHDLAQKYPTSAVAVFVIGTGWAQVDAGAGTLISFAVPRG
jgi:phosphohistidine phosphatase